MWRFSIVLGLALIAPARAGDDRFATVKVTGVVQLPPGASYPAKVKIDIDIAKIEPGKVIIFHKIIGRQEIRTIKSTPLPFAVSAPKSHLKDTPATSFTLRAKVYDLESGRPKLVFETPRDEAVQPFTEAGQAKQNVTLPVKALP